MTPMKRKIEILAPGGDIDSIKAAILAGADAVYFGLDRFNARNRATNIEFESLKGIINLAHKNHCRVFLTLNIIMLGSEIPSLINLLNKLVNTRLDAVIVQDLGLFYLLSTYFKGLDIHASTQMNTHNEGQINFISKLTASRVNLSRELNIDEINALTLKGHDQNILTEVFVHGSYCLSFSGICYMSSVHGGNSGNRGRCSQPCRDYYVTTPEGKNFPLNLKDNSAYFDLERLSDAGVDSIKIEGRIKKFDYVYTVVNCWKKQLGRLENHNRLSRDNSDLYKVFNRDFSNGYLQGDIHKDMFVDNPRDHSIKQLSDISNFSGIEEMEKERTKYYEEKSEIFTIVKDKINQLNIDKIPLIISISGKLDSPLSVSVKTPDTSFVVSSQNNLTMKNEEILTKSLNYNFLLKKFKSLNDTEHYIEHLELENLQKNLFIAFKELSFIKQRILFTLNGSKEIIAPIEMPVLKRQALLKNEPDLAVLISSPKDLSLCDKTSAKFFFQLPNSFKKESVKEESSDLIELFLKNKHLIPWFPSVLIGENYAAAIAFLDQVNPECIVTNNSGIAYEAYKKKIPWIAGPYLNMVNSFSLLCLKERFNCSGAFISNEISKNQISRIIHPENFNLYYSIFHPVLLLSSRQCLFHQVIGCEKDRMDEDCIKRCEKSAVITNLKQVPLLIKKTRGNYPCIYNNHHFLNTEIVNDLPGVFTRFLIDLRDIKTETTIAMDKSDIIRLFENFIKGNPDSKKELQQTIHPVTNIQYKKGI